MRWVRSNTRFGSWLALAALAVQIAVSFGHVHLDGIHRGAAGVTVAAAAAHASRSLPAQQPAGDADDYCAICATIFLAANSFLPHAPQLAVPFVSQAIEHIDRVAVAVIVPRRAPFQSRAPPIA